MEKLRLSALRSNNIEEYKKLLSEAKNNRLSYLLSQVSITVILDRFIPEQSRVACKGHKKAVIIRRGARIARKRKTGLIL